MKPVLGLKNKIVLSTFGLLSKGKGIEHVIQALPAVIKREPRIVYYVLGVTHPQVKRTDGEAYRNMLLKMAKNLGLRGHVKFLNRFLSKPELFNYLQRHIIVRFGCGKSSGFYPLPTCKRSPR